MIEIDERILATSLEVGEVSGFQVRLVKDQRYFWILVISRRQNVSEWHDLDPDHHLMSHHLVRHLTAGLKQATGAEQMNVAAIGNVVPQLHIHIVARNPGDQHWPQPIWGQGKPEPLAKMEEAWRMAVCKDLLTTFRAPQQTPRQGESA